MSAWSMTANKGGGGGTVKAPPGNHPAVLVGIFDMGHQLDDFDPNKPRWQHRAYFVWELVQEPIAGAQKNHVIGIDLTLSLNEKAKLRKWIEARTGKTIPDGSSFDPMTELGQPCLLNVVMKGDFPKVDGVTAVPKGMTMPKPGYAPTAVLLSEFQAGTAIPEWCPWLYGSCLADHIRACKEIGESKPVPKKGGQAAAGGGQSAERPPGDEPPGEDAAGPDPAARWDYHDGKAWVKGKSTGEVAHYLADGPKETTKVWVKVAGAPNETAKRAHEFGFGAAPSDPIPF